MARFRVEWNGVEWNCVPNAVFLIAQARWGKTIYGPRRNHIKKVVFMNGISKGLTACT